MANYLTKSDLHDLVQRNLNKKLIYQQDASEDFHRTTLKELNELNELNWIILLETTKDSLIFQVITPIQED